MGVEVRDRASRERCLEEIPRRTGPFVTISRQAAAGGTQVARIVADRLGWDCLDREILHYIAESCQLPEAILQHVDEARFNWLWDVFGAWLDRKTVTQTEYVSRLGRVLMLAARHGPTVIVGRGGQFILPRERGVLVRLVAPLRVRVERWAALQEIALQDAASWIESQDRDRTEFVKRYFHRDVADPECYDLVINMELLQPAEAADLIVHVCRSRFQDELPS